MITALVNRCTNERLVIELEIGQAWWVRGSDGQVEQAERDHFPQELWAHIGSDLPSDAYGFHMNGKTYAPNSPP